MDRFRGRFYHTIDAKGRVSIPSGYRAMLQSKSDQAPFVTNGVTDGSKCLWLYPYEGWERYENRLAGLPPDNIKMQKYVRFMVSGASPCPIDNQGRMLLPAYLREYASLQREVTFAGVGNRIEIWDKTLFEENNANTQENIEDVALAVADLDW
jgi:MraZ protein